MSAAIAPAVPDPAALSAAQARFAAVLGAEAVLDDQSGLSAFHDPFEGPAPHGHRPALVVQPANVEQVQAALRVARESGLHVWTSSKGRNYGYGGSAPVADGAVVINLSRMNRILDIDATHGTAVIEPGVSFADLYAALRRDNVPLMMSVPDLGWGSIIGNALEHGIGYNVMGDHASALCGMEVVLPDGSLLRTGQGALPESPLWHRHRRGFGPAVDDLFKQSNLGIVTKAGLHLMPRPEVIATGTIRCEAEEDIVPLIAMVRRLLQSGVLQGVPMLVSSPPMAIGSGEGRFTAENLRQVLRPGRWNLRFGLYGHEALVRARRDLLERELAAIPGAVMEMRQYAGDAGPEDVEPRDLIAAGIPNQVLLDRLKGVFGDSFGHMDFSPVLPIDPDYARRAETLLGETMARHGLIGAFGLLCFPRSMVSASLVMFDAADQARVDAARAAVRHLCDEVATWGCAPYRAHVALVDHVQGKFAFGQNAMARFYTTLKEALDPAGLLAPGNHGIWTSGGRGAS